MLNSSCSDESIHPAPTRGRESINTDLMQDKGVDQSTELQDEQESGHPATTGHGGEQGRLSAVQEKESSTSDGVGGATSPAAAEIVEQPKKRPPVVSLHVVCCDRIYLVIHVSFQNPSRCWWLSVCKWAEEQRLTPNLVEHINNKFSTADDPYRISRTK